MENNAKAERDERILDGLIKIAAIEVFHEEMDALPSDEELAKMYPSVKAFEKRGFAIINREFRTINRKKALRNFSRIAAAFCVFMGVCVTVLMAYPATRNLILNFLIDVRDDHVIIEFDINAVVAEADFGTDFSFLPDDFSLIEHRALENMVIYAFENPEGHVIMVDHFLGHSLSVALDNEYAHFSEIQLSTGTAHISVANYENNLSTVVWAEGDGVILITTTLDAETLKTLAENYMQR